MLSRWTVLAVGALVSASLVATPAGAESIYVSHALAGEDVGSEDPALPVDVEVTTPAGVVNCLAGVKFGDAASLGASEAGDYTVGVRSADGHCTGALLISEAVTISALDHAVLLVHARRDGLAAVDKRSLGTTPNFQERLQEFLVMLELEFFNCVQSCVQDCEFAGGSPMFCQNSCRSSCIPIDPPGLASPRQSTDVRSRRRVRELVQSIAALRTIRDAYPIVAVVEDTATVLARVVTTGETRSFSFELSDKSGESDESGE